MPETPSDKRQADEKIPKKGTLDKYKWWIVGGLGVIAVLVFYFVNKSKQNATSSTTGTLNNPSAYGAYMSPYGFGGYGGWGMGGTTGPAGSRGGRGRRGRRGATGPAGSGSPSHPRRHTLWWFQHHGYDVTKDKNPSPLGGPNKGISKSGSRTQAMQNVAARRAWNTRIIPSPLQNSYRV